MKHYTIITLLALATLLSSVTAAESRSSYNIKDYGAVADGKTLCSPAFQSAIRLIRNGIINPLSPLSDPLNGTPKLPTQKANS